MGYTIEQKGVDSCVGRAYFGPPPRGPAWYPLDLCSGYSRSSARSINLITDCRPVPDINTFAASYLNTQRLNNSCLKSPASTLVDLTFQSRAVRSFSLNQLRNLSLLVGNLHSSFSISSWHYLYPFYSSVCLHCDIMNPCLSLCLEGEWAVSDREHFWK